MRLRPDTRTSSRCPLPLQLEVLESRRVLSGGAAFLTAPAFDPPSPAGTAAITPAPADSRAHDQNPGKGQGSSDARSDDGRGLGSLVSTWKHEGIHGKELAALIHQAQGMDGSDSRGGNTGGSGPGSGGHVAPHVIFGPSVGDGVSGKGQSTIPGQENSTPLAQQINPEATLQPQGGNSGTQPAIPTDQVTFLPGAPALLLAPVSPVGEGGISEAVLASSPPFTAAGLLGLPLITGLHGDLTSNAPYAPSGLSPLNGAQGLTVRVGTPEVAEQASGGVQMALPPAGIHAQPGGGNEGPEEVPPAVQESDLLTNVLAANFPGLEGDVNDLVRSLEDLFARLGSNQVGWAFGPALAVAAAALAYVEVRRRKRRKQRLASSAVSAQDADTGPWFPVS